MGPQDQGFSRFAPGQSGATPESVPIPRLNLTLQIPARKIATGAVEVRVQTPAIALVAPPTVRAPVLTNLTVQPPAKALEACNAPELTNLTVQLPTIGLVA